MSVMSHGSLEDAFAEVSWQEIADLLGVHRSTVEHAGRKAIRRIWRSQVTTLLSGAEAAHRYRARQDITPAMLAEALAAEGGNLSRVAKSLGVARSTLQRRMRSTR